MTRPLLLFTTTDYANGPSEALMRMIASVDAFVSANPRVPVQSRLLLQRAAADGPRDFPAWVTVSAVPDRMSLSAARNRMLDEATAAGIADDAILAFPDDDAWYPVGSLEHIVAAFAARPDLDLWFCRYGRAAEGTGQVEAVTPGLQQTLSFASSNTTVVSGWLLRHIGHFDESLGVGTPAGGGEDTEFAMRAYHAARAKLFWDVMAIGHRDTDPAIRSKYYGGSLRAIAMHARASGEARRALLRKVLVGAAFVALGRMSPGAFVGAIRAAR